MRALTDYDKKILAVLNTKAGLTSGDIADQVKPMFGTNRRQHCAAVLSWLKRMEKEELVARMDHEKPIAWVKVEQGPILL